MPTSKRSTKKPAPAVRRPATSAASVPAPDPQLELFGRAIAATQQKRWKEAATLLRRLLHDTDDDPGLAERARQYLSLCEQRLANGHEKHADDDPYLQAVIAKNRGDFAAALAIGRFASTIRMPSTPASRAAAMQAPSPSRWS